MEITLINYNPAYPILINYYTESWMDLGWTFEYTQNGNIITWDVQTFYDANIPSGFPMWIQVTQNEEIIYSELQIIE